MASTTDGTEANAWEESLIADLRANGGRPSGGPLAGHPLMLLHSTGARSGENRRSILTYSRDGDDFVVAGTAGGGPKTPAWVANLTADPNVSLEVDNETFDGTAEVFADGAERDRLWDQHVAQLPWFGEYPSKITNRVIPVVRVTRRAKA
jgi:deazaflavin-dependent oxidoreductase (nitroreductase family)